MDSSTPSSSTPRDGRRVRIRAAREPRTRPAAMAILARAAPWVLVGLALRLPFMSLESGDFRGFVGVWLATLERDGFRALATPFADYAPAYLYLLWLTTFVPLPYLLATKLLSIAFDGALAAAAAAVGRSCGLSGRATVTLGGVVFLLPTVILNSAAWAQCDSIYSAAVVASLGLFARGRGSAAFLALGAGIAFKAQAAFVVPFVLVLTLRGLTPWRGWLLIPLPYLFAALPAALAGRPVIDLLTVYVAQAEKYGGLTLNAPTLYAWTWLGTSWGEAGIAAGALIILAATALAVRAARLSTSADRVALATFFLVLVPFVLPRMHERYFFVADVLATVYAFLRPSRWFVPVLVVSASTASYFPFLFGFELLPLPIAAAAMAAALGVLMLDVFPEARARVVRIVRMILGAERVRVAVQFALVGAASTLLFLVFYGALRRVADPPAANATALLLTMVLNFAANRSLSFRKRRSSIRVEFPSYVAIYMSGLGASILAFHVALDAAGGKPGPGLELVLVVLSGAIGTVLRFALLTRLVYPHRDVIPAARSSTGAGPAPGSADL